MGPHATNAAGNKFNHQNQLYHHHQNFHQQYQQQQRQNIDDSSIPPSSSTKSVRVFSSSTGSHHDLNVRSDHRRILEEVSKLSPNSSRNVSVLKQLLLKIAPHDFRPTEGEIPEQCGNQDGPQDSRSDWGGDLFKPILAAETGGNQGAPSDHPIVKGVDFYDPGRPVEQPNSFGDVRKPILAKAETDVTLKQGLSSSVPNFIAKNGFPETGSTCITATKDTTEIEIQTNTDAAATVVDKNEKETENCREIPASSNQSMDHDNVDDTEGVDFNVL